MNRENETIHKACRGDQDVFGPIVCILRACGSLMNRRSPQRSAGKAAAEAENLRGTWHSH